MILAFNLIRLFLTKIKSHFRHLTSLIFLTAVIIVLVFCCLHFSETETLLIELRNPGGPLGIHVMPSLDDPGR